MTLKVNFFHRFLIIRLLITLLPATIAGFILMLVMI